MSLNLTDGGVVLEALEERRRKIVRIEMSAYQRVVQPAEGGQVGREVRIPHKILNEPCGESCSESSVRKAILDKQRS